MADEKDYRAEAVQQLVKADGASNEPGDACGPEPERPNYFSPADVRKRWVEWNLCKAGA